MPTFALYSGTQFFSWLGSHRQLGLTHPLSEQVIVWGATLEIEECQPTQ